MKEEERLEKEEILSERVFHVEIKSMKKQQKVDKIKRKEI
jgi:hypothetical protein